MSLTNNGNRAAADGMAQFAERMRQQLGRAEELQTRLAELRGRAESEDGLVVVVCTADDPAQELHIDPRATRQPVADLAELIQKLIREARADLSERTNEVLHELGGAVGPAALLHNQAAAQAKLAQLNDLVSGPLRNSTEMLERMRRQLGL